MPRGKKTCDKCGTQTGPRAYICPECQTPFAFKPQSKERKSTKFIRNFDWKELQAGDRIKATGGPYYVTGGEFIPMGCRGRFTVMSLDDNGIIAYGAKSGGWCHIWMGRDEQCPTTKIWRTRHKLVKIKKKIQNA